MVFGEQRADCSAIENGSVWGSPDDTIVLPIVLPMVPLVEPGKDIGIPLVEPCTRAISL